jgi:hypothetical protein
MVSRPGFGSWYPTHRHRNGNRYMLVWKGDAFIENGMVPAVIYAEESGRIWIRPEAEFFDGRFTPIKYIK